jgi:hypothetical protein
MYHSSLLNIMWLPGLNYMHAVVHHIVEGIRPVSSTI